MFKKTQTPNELGFLIKYFCNPDYNKLKMFCPTTKLADLP